MEKFLKIIIKKYQKSYYGEIQHNDEYFKLIEKMLSDDWEGDEEIFCSRRGMFKTV